MLVNSSRTFIPELVEQLRIILGFGDASRNIRLFEGIKKERCITHNLRFASRC